MNKIYRRLLFYLNRSFGSFAAIMATFAGSAAFGNTITNYHVSFDPNTEIGSFDITFSSVPNFFNLDDFGRPEDSFQFWIYPSAILPTPSNPYSQPGYPDEPGVVVIRGVEIDLSGGVILRDEGPDTGDPNGGGWGPIIGLVPFSVSGTSAMFSVPTDLFGTDGEFSYYLEGNTYGRDNFDAAGVATISVPEAAPTSLLLALGLSPLALTTLKKKRQTQLLSLWQQLTR